MHNSNFLADSTHPDSPDMLGGRKQYVRGLKSPHKGNYELQLPRGRSGMDIAAIQQADELSSEDECCIGYILRIRGTPQQPDEVDFVPRIEHYIKHDGR